MGKLARLNATKSVLNSRYWIAVTKTDFTYDLKTEVDGKEVIERAGNVFYIPLGTPTGHVIPFKSTDEAKDWLKQIVDTTSDQKELEQFYMLDIHLLCVRNVPSKRKRFNQSWMIENVTEDLSIRLQDLKSTVIS